MRTGTPPVTLTRYRQSSTSSDLTQQLSLRHGTPAGKQTSFHQFIATTPWTPTVNHSLTSATMRDRLLPGLSSRSSKNTAQTLQTSATARQLTSLTTGKPSLNGLGIDPMLTFIAAITFAAAACSTVPSVSLLLLMAGAGFIILQLALIA